MLRVLYKLLNDVMRTDSRLSTSLGTPWPYQQNIHSLFYLPTQMSLAARSIQSGEFQSLQGSVGAGGPLPKDGNGDRGHVFVEPFAGEFIETDSPPSSNIEWDSPPSSKIKRDSPPSSNFERAGPSSCEYISLLPAPLTCASHPEGAYMNAGRCCLLSVLTYIGTYVHM